MKEEIAKVGEATGGLYQKREHPDYIVLASDLINMGFDQIRMLYDGLILAVGVWAIVGASDTCKSMILRQLAMCIAEGGEFLSRAFNGKYRSVIIVCTEDDAESISVLLNKQNKTLNLSVEALSRVRFIFDAENLLMKLEEALKYQAADLVIIDAFGDVFDGKDLNQNNQVRSFLNQYTIIAKKHECSLCFLHHTGKRTEELAPSKNNSIGSQGFEAKMRLVIELRVDASDDNLRHLCIVKGNYLPGEAKISSYVLRKDENLVFTDTGSRTLFDDLAVKREGGNSERKSKSPYDIEDDTHIGFLQDAFHTKDTVFSFTALREQVMRRFGVGDQKAREYIQFYSDRKWIINKSKTQNRKEFHLNEFNIKPLF